MAHTPNPRRRPRQKRSREKVARILDTARRLLEEEGPAAFNTNRIAKEAGIGVGSLYEYFPNKAAIALRLRERLSESEVELVLARFAELEEASLDTLLMAMVELTFTLYRKHHALRSALWAMAPGDRISGQHPSERRILDLIQARLQALHPHRDVTLPATVAFHIIESLATQLIADDRWDDATSAAEVARVARAYIDSLNQT
ncbi:MAG: helix-turn-helix domain-containing protein [Myxococcota bacterium]